MHNHIMRLDFLEAVANSDGDAVPGTEIEKTIIFNNLVISMEETLKLMKSGNYEYDQRIIVTSKKAADAVLCGVL